MIEVGQWWEVCKDFRVIVDINEDGVIYDWANRNKKIQSRHKCQKRTFIRWVKDNNASLAEPPKKHVTSELNLKLDGVDVLSVDPEAWEDLFMTWKYNGFECPIVHTEIIYTPKYESSLHKEVFEFCPKQHVKFYVEQTVEPDIASYEHKGRKQYQDLSAWLYGKDEETQAAICIFSYLHKLNFDDVGKRYIYNILRGKFGDDFISRHKWHHTQQPIPVRIEDIFDMEFEKGDWKAHAKLLVKCAAVSMALSLYEYEMVRVKIEPPNLIHT